MRSLKIDLHLSLNLYLDFSLVEEVIGKFSLLHLLVFCSSYQIWFLKLLCNVQFGEFLQKYLVFVVKNFLEHVWAVLRELVELLVEHVELVEPVEAPEGQLFLVVEFLVRQI